MPAMLVQTNIFHAKGKQRQKHDHSFLFIPRNVIHDWKFIDIIQLKTSFNFSAITARE